MYTFVFDKGRKNEMTGQTFENKLLVKFVFSICFDCEILIDLLILSRLLDGTEFPIFPSTLSLKRNVRRLQHECSFSIRQDEDP